MNTIPRSMDGWHTLPWTRLQRQVLKRPKRRYRATRRHDVRTVRKRQRLLLHSWSVRLLAVRHVTQDQRGTRTAGVDGVTSFPPPTPRPGTVPDPRGHHGTCPPRLDPATRLDGAQTARHPDMSSILPLLIERHWEWPSPGYQAGLAT